MVTFKEIYIMASNLKNQKDIKNKYEELLKKNKDKIHELNLAFYDLYSFEYNRKTIKNIK